MCWQWNPVVLCLTWITGRATRGGKVAANKAAGCEKQLTVPFLLISKSLDCKRMIWHKKHSIELLVTLHGKWSSITARVSRGGWETVVSSLLALWQHFVTVVAAQWCLQALMSESGNPPNCTTKKCLSESQFQFIPLLSFLLSLSFGHHKCGHHFAKNQTLLSLTAVVIWLLQLRLTVFIHLCLLAACKKEGMQHSSRVTNGSDLREDMDNEKRDSMASAHSGFVWSPSHPRFLGLNFDKFAVLPGLVTAPLLVFALLALSDLPNLLATPLVPVRFVSF